MWWREDGHGQYLKFAGGVWSPVRPPLEAMPNTLDSDGEGRLLVKYARPNEADAVYRIHRGESNQLKALPRKYHDESGQSHEAPGEAQSSQGIAGGGILRSPAIRYFPMASF